MAEGKTIYLGLFCFHYFRLVVCTVVRTQVDLIFFSEDDVRSQQRALLNNKQNSLNNQKSNIATTNVPWVIFIKDGT